MIHVQNLVKRFAGVTAVDGLSFEVARGEVVGLLGPNGAGKTTTLRMLAGYLPPTGGEIRIAGLPVEGDVREVRKRVGYLPEHCPLYPEMRVEEFLCYRAELKGVPARTARARVREVSAHCGIEDVRRRIIGQLSKGYRQRVGLADALVHDPELLILDEPTIGLDPNQIRQVRDLIRGLADRHTILISSHILHEIEMTCGRVLILAKGQLRAADSTENLRRLMARRGHVIAQLRAPEADLRKAFEAVGAGAWSARPMEDGWVEIRFDDTMHGGDAREAVAAGAARRGWALRELRHEESSLEDIFVALTGVASEEPAA
jgi:ABC-2 type transport system ATP-binding protein